MVTDNSVVKAWGWGQGQARGVHWGEKADMYNTFNYKDLKKYI